MIAKMEQFPATNPNPVLCVANNGTVSYSNEAGEPLLLEWGVRIGEKLPFCIGDLVQRVFSRNSPEIIEVEVGKRIYSLAFHLLPEDRCVNIYGFDISDQKDLERKLLESEEDLAEVQKMAHIGNWKWDIVTNELHWSDEVYRIFGLNPQEFEATFDTYFHYVHPDDRDYLNNAIKKAFEGDPYSVDNRILTANGDERIVHTDAEITFNEDNVPVYARGIVQDITERKQAEEAFKKANDSLEVKVKERTEELETAYNSLKESEERLAEAQKIAHIGSWERNIATNKFVWSNEMYRIFGLKPQEFEVTYSLFLNYVHLDDQGRVDNAVKEALNGKPIDIDFRIIPTNGKERIVHAKGEIVFDDNNNPVRVRGTTQDITEYKKSQEKLRKSEEKYRNIVETANEGIALIGSEGVITYVNQKMADMLGYAVEEIVDRMICDFVEEEDVSTVTTRWEKRRRGSIESYDLKLICKDGLLLWALINSKPLFDENGKFMGALNLYTDITERKQAEKALQKQADLIDLSPDGIIICQLDGTISFWSKGAQSMYGWTCQEAIGQQIHILLRTQFSQPFEQISEQVQQTGHWSGELIHCTKDGRQVIVQSRWQAEFDDQGNVREILESNVDITERKQAEEMLRLSEEKFSKAFSTNPAAISITRLEDGLIMDVNDIWLTTFGYSREEVIGTSISLQLWPTPEDRARIVQELREKGPIYGRELMFLRRSGEPFTALASAVILTIEGKEVVLSTWLDITEHKRAEEKLQESEERLRRFYESGIFGILYYNLDGLITDANDKFLEIIGYTREDLQAGRINWNKMTPPEYCFLDEHAIVELKATGVTKSFEKEYIRKDGSRVPIILGITTFDQVRNEGIAFVLDITEKKKAEEALANIEIARKKEIHHRIKNNLQVISSLLDLQAEKFRNRGCIKDSEVLEAFRESQDRVISMALIHEELYKGGGFDTLDFSSYIQELSENLFLTYKLGN